MKTEFEQQEIERIANKVAELLKPMFRAVKHEDADFLMTIEELAKYMRCSIDFIYKLTQAKEIPHIKRGSKFLLFRKNQIDKWLDSLAVPVVNMPVSLLKKFRPST
jgi:excisionase family DNA binding protein